MAARVYWIEGPWKGRLAIVPRPYGGDGLADAVTDWRKAGINAVVSFLLPDEITEFDLKAEKELCEAQGIRFISFAIPDRKVPASKRDALTLVRDLKQLLVNGKNIGLHCRQSVGRSALIAACLLVSVGEEPSSAFARISAVRGGKVPDTTEQQQWVADLEKDMPTKGERLFEAYLLSQGITNYEFEKRHPDKSARPDYSVTLDREYLFEVKDFEPKDLLMSGAYDPYTRIREKINQGYRKFKEYKEWPCCLVLYNNNASLVDLESPEIVLGAMYGNYGVSMEFNPELGTYDPTTKSFRFLKGGKMFRPNSSEPQNTTISALITLRQVDVGPKKLKAFLGKQMKQKLDITPVEAFAETFSPDIDFDKHERQLGVIVWENMFARIPFPRHLFSGPYDERWVQKGHIIERVVGSGIAALEALEDSEAPLQNVS
jgi:hypothetical protein